MEVQIKFTYKYSEELLYVYHKAINCEVFSKHKSAISLSLHEADFELRELLKYRFYDSTQMAVMEIYYNDKLVGMSLPRHTYSTEEKLLFNVDSSYNKIGKLFILEEYRNKDIAYSACKQFLSIYPKVMYHTAEDNIASLNLVSKLGIPFSHNVSLNGINYKVFKSR